MTLRELLLELISYTDQMPHVHNVEKYCVLKYFLWLTHISDNINPSIKIEIFFPALKEANFRESEMFVRLQNKDYLVFL